MKVIVVATVRLYRELLAAALSENPGVDVVGTAAEGIQAQALAVAVDPAIAVVDIGLLLQTDLVAQLTGVCPRIRIIVLGIRDDAPQIVACAEMGVAGYVMRDAGVAELVEVLHEIKRGELRCTPVVAASLMRRVSELADAVRAWEPAGGQLTAREREILALVEQGLMNKEIARQLGLSLSTVKNHVHNVLDKLGLSSRSDAARWHRDELARHGLHSRTRVLELVADHR